MRNLTLILSATCLLFSCVKKKTTPPVVEQNNSSSSVDTVDGKAEILGTYMGSYSEHYQLSVPPGYANYDYPNCKLEITVVGDTMYSTVTNLDSTYPGGWFERFASTPLDFLDTTTTIEMNLYPGDVFSQCRSLLIKYKPQSDSIYFNGGKVCSTNMSVWEFMGKK